METVVLYNLGIEAAKNGGPRICPDEIDYPVRSKYRSETSEKAWPCDYMKQQYTRGFDSWHK